MNRFRTTLIGTLLCSEAALFGASPDPHLADAAQKMDRATVRSCLAATPM